mmetsp:Transcript_12801/g.30445  ORF Transcript_12801/g.30445 Transcript_12801/m.30445 type:complete len:391 (-) Transcript_12801:529-1701(-)
MFLPILPLDPRHLVAKSKASMQLQHVQWSHGSPHSSRDQSSWEERCRPCSGLVRLRLRLRLCRFLSRLGLQLGLKPAHVRRVANVEEGVAQKGDAPGDANRGRHGHAQGVGGVQIPAIRHVLLTLEHVPEGLGEVRHQQRPHGRGDGVLQGALPRHDLAAVLGRHDVRQDGEVGAALRPVSQQTEGGDHCEVQAEGRRLGARLQAREPQVHQRDAHGDAELRTQRAAVVAQAPRQRVGDDAPQQIPKDAHHGAFGGEEGALPVLQAGQLEEEKVVGHDGPGDGAENPLHHHDTKRRHAQEAHHDEKLLHDGRAARLANGVVQLLRGLRHAKADHETGAHRRQAAQHEEGPPPGDPADGNVGQIASHQSCDAHPHQQRALHIGEHLAAAVI